MKKLDGIKANGTQRLSTTASNGDIINIVLTYNAATQSFKMDVECNDFILNGFKVFLGLNLLCQYKNIIPFGIAVIADGSAEPFLINDFSSGRCTMYILTPEEIEEIEDYFVGLRDAG